MARTQNATLAEAIPAYLEWCTAVRNLRSNTTAAYGFALRTVFADLMDTPLAALTPARM